MLEASWSEAILEAVLEPSCRRLAVFKASWKRLASASEASDGCILRSLGCVLEALGGSWRRLKGHDKQGEPRAHQEVNICEPTNQNNTLSVLFDNSVNRRHPGFHDFVRRAKAHQALNSFFPQGS